MKDERKKSSDRTSCDLNRSSMQAGSSLAYSVRTKQSNIRKKRVKHGKIDRRVVRRKYREEKMRERVEFALVVDKPRRLPRNVILKVFSKLVVRSNPYNNKPICQSPGIRPKSR